MVYVACSGGIGGAGALHCAPDALYIPRLAAQRSPVYLSMHPLPQRDAYP